MYKVLLGVLYLLLVSCAYIPARSDYTVGAVPPALEADSNDAVLYFLRERASDYDKLFLVDVMNTEIGILQGDSYFVCKLPAGKYNFWIKTDRNVLVSIFTQTVEAGKTYYFYREAEGFLRQSKGFTAIGAEQAKVLLQTYTYYHLLTPEEKLQVDILSGKKPPQ